MKTLATTVMILGMASVLSIGTPASAQTFTCEEEELVEAGKIDLTIKSAGLIVGAKWGEGTVTLNNGDTHTFSIKGGKVGVVGGSSVQASGTVYNLPSMEDFSGKYAGVGAGATLVKGLGGLSFQNGKCVLWNLRASSRGLELSAGPGGLEVTLEN